MEKHYEYHLNLPRMSGRVVRFRELDVDDVEQLEADGARAAGEDADGREIRRQQMRLLLAAFVVEYSEPKQVPLRVPVMKDGKPLLESGQPVLAVEGGRADPEKLKEARFTKVTDTALFARAWKTLFSTKESQALRVLYLEMHEVNGAEMQMLLGKALPLPQGG